MSAQMILNGTSGGVGFTIQPQSDTGVVKGALLLTGAATVVGGTPLTVNLGSPIPSSSTLLALPISALQSAAVTVALPAVVAGSPITSIVITAPVSGIVQWFVFA